jgi:hypothetical protein
MAFNEQVVATCDAPGCTKSAIVVNDTLPRGWFEGTVATHRDDADGSTEWLACRPTHIKPAVEKAAATKKDNA